jgi:hypothetical protein
MTMTLPPAKGAIVVGSSEQAILEFASEVVRVLLLCGLGACFILLLKGED